MAVALRASGGADPLVELDASKLKPGALTACAAGGSAAAAFSAGGVSSITVGEVSGRRAVTFAGGDWLTSSFTAPAGLTGRSAYTVAVWALNPEIGGEECMVQWARRGMDSRTAHFNYGTAPASGAVVHWGSGDMGYERNIPAPNQWHHLAVTYTGGAQGTETIYVDGKVVASEVKALDLLPDGPINIGQALDAQGFTGSMGSVRMYGEALAAGDVASLAADKPVAQKPLVDLDAAGLEAGALWEWRNGGSAGGVFRRASIPRVETVEGRPAILFDGAQSLASDAPLSGIAAGGAFTVEAWLLNPALGGGESYAALAAPDAWPVQFNFSRSPMDGAFFSEHGAMSFAVRPSAGAWHHLAVVYGGAQDGRVVVYVDGERDDERRMEVRVPADARLVLGGGGRRGFSGAMAMLRVYGRALSQYELRSGNGMNNAFNPSPRGGATVDTLAPVLGWERGVESAKRFAVYLGRDRAAVEQRVESARAGEAAADAPKFGPVNLNIGETYYWRVDQLDAAGSNAWPGVVWSFHVNDGRPSGAVPRDRTANTTVEDRELAWTPGRFATRQFLYFGTDPQSVASASAPTVGDLPGDSTRCPIPGALKAGTRYYWRVDSENGSQPRTTGAVWAFRTQDAPVTNDVTFLVVSDTHYTPEPASSAGVRSVIDALNWIPGTPYPDDLGGCVRTPRGVLHTGDMTDSGEAPFSPSVWKMFTTDFGVNGEGRVCYPVFEIVGNHDGGDGFPPQEGVKERNRQRKGLTGISENGLHYSWTWDDFHFVALNKFAGSASDPSRPFNQRWNDPTHSLEFLKEDLAKNAVGRPTVLLQHYGFDGFSAGWGWWSPKDRAATWDAIRDYNIVAYLHGHTHAMTFMKWQGQDFHLEGQRMPEQGIDVIGCASGQRGPETPGEFMVFHITTSEMTVAHRFVDHWGQTLRIPIPPKPRWPRKTGE